MSPFADQLLGVPRIAAFIASGEMGVAHWMAHAAKGLYPSADGGDAA